MKSRNLKLKTLENSFVQEQTENWDEKTEALKTRRGIQDPSKQFLLQSVRGIDLGNTSRVSETTEKENSMIDIENKVLFPKEPVMEECDLKEKDNPQYVSEYATEIFDYLRETEVPTIPILSNLLGKVLA
mgnify:CR=1 FL=1